MKVSTTKTYEYTSVLLSPYFSSDGFLVPFKGWKPDCLFKQPSYLKGSAQSPNPPSLFTLFRLEYRSFRQYAINASPINLSHVANYKGRFWFSGGLCFL